MTKKIKLEVAYEWKGLVLALVSPWPDYKLAWKLSKVLNIELGRQNDLSIPYPGDKKNSFLLYQFKNEYTTFRLLKNRAYQVENSNQPFLLPEIKDFDYIFLLESEAELDIGRISELIREIESVQLLKSFNPETLKSKQNIAF